MKTIRVTDGAGRTMQQVDISGLQPGIYLAELVAADNSRTVQQVCKELASTPGNT